MKTLIILFISVCVNTDCVWFEIQDPVFESPEQCIEAGGRTAQELQEAMPYSSGEIHCVPENSIDDFKEYLEQRGYRLNPKETGIKV